MVRRGVRSTAERGVLAVFLVACAALSAATARADGSLAAPEPEPAQIFNGIDAGVCEFPSAVAMLDRDTGGLFCTGTLIHPQLVLFAAHCMDPESSWATPGSVMFGEDVNAPVRTIPIEECVMHPDWQSGGIDLAACKLPVAVRHVPIVPVMMGCEVDALQPNTFVTIVGFGATSGIVDDEGGVDSSGAGLKRFTQQRVTDVLIDQNDVVMVGPDTGGCFGDSGGPAFAQLPDGTWRVIGAASTLHPQATPDPNGEICGLGTVYEIVFNEMAWLEDFAGFDLTPCHDSDGTWHPGLDCGGFPFAPGAAETTWADGCEVTDLAAWSSTCGAPFSTGPFPAPPGTPPPTPPPPPPPPPPIDPDPIPVPTEGSDDGRTPFESESESESEGEGAGGDKDSGGCGCTNERAPAPAALLLLLALVRRRRRAR